jgi:hypothetical protein
LATLAQELKTHAQEMQVVSDSMLAISATIDRDGQKLNSTFIATSEQAIKLLEETEKALGRLKTQDLPKALAALRTTSENLRNMGVQVDIAGSIGMVLLVVGLLLALWCFVSSVGALMLARAIAVGSNSRADFVAQS